MASSNTTPEYRAYLRSPRWRLIRWLKLCMAGFKCQQCGAIRKLQVHHLTYEHLFNEHLGDLQVLCKSCHLLADEERRRAKAIDTYMRKVVGNDWRSQITDIEATAQFDEWMESKRGAN